jgi:hypothetical protein
VPAGIALIENLVSPARGIEGGFVAVLAPHPVVGRGTGACCDQESQRIAEVAVRAFSGNKCLVRISVGSGFPCQHRISTLLRRGAMAA